jgi:hypothetical protein
VEFALIAPLMVFVLVAVIDFARIYTTILTIESAAREAADYGTFGSQRWNPAIYDVPVNGTKAQMQHRACVASSNLPDFAGSSDACTNPAFAFALSGDKGATWQTDPATVSPVCDDKLREPPCWVKVSLHYDFHVLMPLHVEVLGVQLGLPSVIGIDRDSIFPVTDLELP